VKVATLFFSRADTQRAFADALRARMYAAGYEPHEVTEWFRAWFLPGKARRAIISGTADAERASDVAHEIRGVLCKMAEVP